MIASGQFSGQVNEVLRAVLDTEISPGLIPAGADGKVQSTQDSIGPYALHDFALYYLLRLGYPPRKIAYLAWQAWRDAEAGAWPLALTAGIQRCGGISLRIEVPFAGTPSAEDGKGRHAICIPRPDEPLFLRAPRTGDRIRLPSGTRKLSDLLTDRKVPRPERAKVRVLCAGEAIVWVIGYGAAVISDGESGTALGSRPLVRISVAADHEQDLVGG